jgi:UDP-N-acetyl-D-mannosaminuronic acid dehydrogenase
LADSGYVPRLILAARHLNEDTPRSSARRVLETLRRSGLDLSEITVVVSGLAYKGVPATDEVRGSGAFDVIALLRDGGIGRILGHDFVLSPERIAATGLSPVDLESGARGAHVIMLLNNHRSYGDVDFALIEAVMAEPKLIYDAWGVTGSVPTNLMRLGRA